MGNNFSIINNTGVEVREITDIENLMEFALNYLNINRAIFNIIIVDNETIKNINRDYRGKDTVTDVISFALEDDKSFIESDFRILGVIYISLDRARNQAIEYGHSFKREICFLSVHGLLHLLGYDHMTEEDEKEMFGLQELILNEYGIKR